MKLAALFTVFIFAPLAFSGGDTYLVTIESLEINNERFSIKLGVPDPGWYENNCTTVQVSGRYESEKWQTYNGVLMNFKFHEDTLKMLSSAHNENRAVMFSVFGGGLHKIGKCRYLSIGLFSEGEYFFSVYSNI